MLLFHNCFLFSYLFFLFVKYLDLYYLTCFLILFTGLFILFPEFGFFNFVTGSKHINFHFSTVLNKFPSVQLLATTLHTPSLHVFCMPSLKVCIRANYIFKAVVVRANLRIKISHQYHHVIIAYLP